MSRIPGITRPALVAWNPTTAPDIRSQRKAKSPCTAQNHPGVKEALYHKFVSYYKLFLYKSFQLSLLKISPPLPAFEFLFNFTMEVNGKMDSSADHFLGTPLF